MVKIQKCKRYGVCNDCSKQQSDDTVIWEIRVSSSGQGWNTIMLCKECMLALSREMAVKAIQEN